MESNGVILKIAATAGMLVLFTSCLANAAIADNDSLANRGGSAPGIAQTSTPTEKPTAVIEPTATEMPPEVDLGWHDWMIFKDFWNGSSKEVTNEFLEEHFNPEDYKGPIYMFITRDKYTRKTRTFPYETTTPDSQPGWDFVESLNDEEAGFGFDLNNVEKEILKQYILFRKDDGKKLRLFLFIDDKQEGEEIRCFREQEGSLVVIENLSEEDKLNNEDGKDFKVTIYEDEDIPWYELPRESWEGIQENNTILDLRDGEIRSFCDMDDIKEGVDPR